jgi:hypothetical protein
VMIFCLLNDPRSIYSIPYSLEDTAALRTIHNQY